MKKILLLSIVIAIVVFVRQQHWEKSIKIGESKINIETVDTPEGIEQGLSGRQDLCSDCGMLFVFKKPDIQKFWMRRMYFDIDIIWINNNRVVDITYNVQKPDEIEFEYPTQIYQSSVPCDKVLEVNAGWAEGNAISVGDKVSYSNINLGFISF